MRRLLTYIAVALFLSACATTTPLETRITKLGEEPAGVKGQYIYGLPQTVLKVELTYRESMNIPGPYADYAERYLGISEVIRQKASRWNLHNVAVSALEEPDPEHYYSLNVMKGEFNREALDRLLDKGIILDGTESVHESIKGEGLESAQKPDYLKYVDLGVYTNFEERTETMYKTLVTDTSYVQVPVQRTVVEQKSPSTKAREAADFLLEIRLRRFEMLTGEYEVYPDGEAMGTALNKMDQMEASYLSLFTGKTISRLKKKTWFIVPEKGSEPSRYNLAMFSEQLGFIPSELLEGLPLEVQITPLGKTHMPGSYFEGGGANQTQNMLYYRMPDVAGLKVVYGTEVLSDQRISIFQAGALMSTPVN
ncbi:MAG: DUF4831 family protein [Bacteroidota bacterium]